METRLKERLVGAIVLVAIVVVVVPELLTGPRSGTPAPTPPGAPATPVRVVTFDIQSGQETSSAGTEPRAAAPTQAAPREPATAVTPVQGPAGGASSPSANAPAGLANAPAGASGAVTPTPATSPSNASSGAPAKPVVPTDPERPAATAGAPASVPSRRTPTPAVTTARDAPSPPRDAAAPVREAPTPSRDATAPARDATAPTRDAAKLARATGAPSAPGWVVQLGSFASRPNAEKLAGELRGRGYAAFVSEYRGSGRVLFRVRVGPEQDRARADAVAARLAREGRKGTVTPHP
jgi:DedD protein